MPEDGRWDLTWRLKGLGFNLAFKGLNSIKLLFAESDIFIGQ
jgi:hypothetical protein